MLNWCLLNCVNLQQALELTASPEGIQKKKLVESAKPLAFSRLAAIEVRTVNADHVDIPQNPTESGKKADRN
jgi:hypothetical protein